MDSLNAILSSLGGCGSRTPILLPRPSGRMKPLPRVPATEVLQITFVGDEIQAVVHAFAAVAALRTDDAVWLAEVRDVLVALADQNRAAVAALAEKGLAGLEILERVRAAMDAKDAESTKSDTDTKEQK